MKMAEVSVKIKSKKKKKVAINKFFIKLFYWDPIPCQN